MKKTVFIILISLLFCSGKVEAKSLTPFVIGHLDTVTGLISVTLDQEDFLDEITSQVSLYGGSNTSLVSCSFQEDTTNALPAGYFVFTFSFDMPDSPSRMTVSQSIECEFAENGVDIISVALGGQTKVSCVSNDCAGCRVYRGGCSACAATGPNPKCTKTVDNGTPSWIPTLIGPIISGIIAWLLR